MVFAPEDGCSVHARQVGGVQAGLPTARAGVIVVPMIPFAGTGTSG
jgi:hypothetical protein